MPNKSQNINVDSHIQTRDKLTHLCLAPHGLSNSAAKKSQNQSQDTVPLTKLVLLALVTSSFDV